jgi:hypothetical protein
MGNTRNAQGKIDFGLSGFEKELEKRPQTR